MKFLLLIVLILYFCDYIEGASYRRSFTAQQNAILRHQKERAASHARLRLVRQRQRLRYLQAARTQQVSAYYKSLALRNQKLRSEIRQEHANIQSDGRLPLQQDANIQSDVAGCRDDLCIADEYDPDYFDGGNSPPDYPTMDPGDVPCPTGYQAVQRGGIIYCDVVKETTTKAKQEVTCADNEETFYTSDGVECVPKEDIQVVTTPFMEDATTSIHDDDIVCKPEEQLIQNEHGAICISVGSVVEVIEDLFGDTKDENMSTTPAEVVEVSPTEMLSTITRDKATSLDKKEDMRITTTLEGMDLATWSSAVTRDESTSSDVSQHAQRTDKAITTEYLTQSIIENRQTTASTDKPLSMVTDDPVRRYPHIDEVNVTVQQSTKTSVTTDLSTPRKDQDRMDISVTAITPLITVTNETDKIPDTSGKPDHKTPNLNDRPTIHNQKPYISTTKTTVLIPESTVVPPEGETFVPLSGFNGKLSTVNPLPPQAGESEYFPTGRQGKSGDPGIDGNPELNKEDKELYINQPMGKPSFSSTAFPNLKHISSSKENPKFMLDITTTPRHEENPDILGGIPSFKPNFPGKQNPKFMPGITARPRFVSEKHQGFSGKGASILRPGKSGPSKNKKFDSMMGKSKKNKFNTINGQQFPVDLDEQTKFDETFIGPKLSMCEDGKVLVGTKDGYKCMEPVYPEGVCPPDRIPYLASMGIQCLPCPFGHTVMKTEGGVKCVAMTTESPRTVEMRTEGVNLCPDGLQPFHTAAGRVCRYMSTPGLSKEENIDCLVGQRPVFVGGEMKCVNQDGCQPGQVPVITETGETVCGFDATLIVDDCVNQIDGMCQSLNKHENEILANICPPGLKAIHKSNGEISCQYIIEEDTTKASMLPVARCGQQELLTHTSRGFVCQRTNSLSEDMIPACPEGSVMVQLGPFHDCISEFEANLICQETEELTRQDEGFVCLKKWEGPVELPCGDDRVMVPLENGQVQCLSLLEAGEHCGDGFLAVKQGDGFLCKPERVDVQCPEGYMLKLVKGSPACVSTSEPDCKAVDGSMSTLCVTDLETPDDLDLDTIIETKLSCEQGQIVSLEDGKPVCIDGGGVEPAVSDPCAAEGVRPCDLDISILLQGCNPDCANGGTCVDGKCLCPQGITGVACSQDIDECLTVDKSMCDYQCENTFGSYQCACPTGKIRSSNGRSCEEAVCIPDCLNGGQCVAGRCHCLSGFKGDYCEIDEDECSLYGNRLCQYYCRNTYGGYQCLCPPGSRLNQDKRTCSNTTCIPSCRNGGRCENHKCHCPPGRYGIICQLDMNECHGHSPCQHECVNTQGSYSCVCNQGYRLALDRHSCV